MNAGGNAKVGKESGGLVSCENSFCCEIIYSQSRTRCC